MASSYPQPGPPMYTRQERSNRKAWIWAVVGVAVLFLFGLYECGSKVYTTFHSGWTEASAAAHQFHEELNAANFDQISSEADPGFQDPDKRQELIKFLTAVHTKLGNATSEKLTNLNLHANTNGRFIVATFSSHFEKGDAEETIVWKRDGETLRLYRYNINSDAFVIN
jgi:hypothetical protein